MTFSQRIDYEADKGKLAESFLLTNVRNRIFPEQEIENAVFRIQTFEEARDLTVSAFLHPNPMRSAEYGLLARKAVWHVNYQLESGRFHTAVESNESGSLEDLIYDALLGKPINPVDVASKLSEIAILLNQNVRIMTLEKLPNEKKGLIYVMPFSLYKDRFITRSFPEGVNFESIVSSESPDAIFKLGADLAKHRTYKGSYGNEHDNFDSVMEYAYCEMLMLYLTPLYLYSQVDEVREILLNHNDVDGLALFESILAFQQGIVEAVREQDYDKIMPVLYMIGIRQIYGLNGIVRDTISKSKDSEIAHADIVRKLTKKSAIAKGGQKIRVDTLLGLLEQSDFGIEFGFMHAHEETEIVEHELARLGYESKQMLDSISNEAHVQLRKKGITLRGLDTESVCSKEFNIIEVFYSEVNGNVIATFSNKHGTTYKLDLSTELHVSDHALYVLQACLRYLLSIYDPKTKTFRPMELVKPQEVEEAVANLDVVDTVTAEVRQVPQLQLLLTSGYALLTGIVSPKTNNHVYVTTVDKFDNLLSKFEMRLLRAIYPVPTIVSGEHKQVNKVQAVQLGDSSATIQKKIEQRKKQKAGAKVVDKPGRIDSWQALRDALEEQKKE